MTASPSLAMARSYGTPAMRLDLVEPAVDGAGHHSGKRFFALGRARVALEEEAFQLP